MPALTKTFKGFTGDYQISQEQCISKYGAGGYGIEINGDVTIEVWYGLKGKLEDKNKAWETAEMIAKAGELAQKYGSLEELERLYKESQKLQTV